MDKICGTCKETKPVERFAKKRGGLSSKCKDCHNAYQKEYWQKTEAYDKHKERMRENKRANRAKVNSAKYGITEEEYLEGMKKPCDICSIKTAAVVDHCHKTGAVRGFLCSGCNTGIGLLGDTLDRVKLAIVYLEKQQGTVA